MSWDEGSAHAVLLLRELSEISIFKSGWEILGTALNDDEAAFLEKGRIAQEGEGSNGRLFFMIAGNARGPVPPFLRMESYFATIDFDQNQGRLTVTIDLRPELATIDTIFEIIKRFAAWSPLQHVSTTPATYAEYDAPIDHVRRRGIGWAGWVPFQLTQEQVPEAAILEPVGNGTFLATQRTYWAVQDREAVRRAQALELRLNDLGMLPTRRVLSRGTWGTTDP
ncbi:hypothetical protein [Yoonia sp. 2307UL14-13]|uniref:hypothetical protein n=1 Tax=Yoonia sp. 2307UL14-13 TaxID=3126506 RepID=UPI0030965CC5